MNRRALAQILRLPALPTALADICLGALASDLLPRQSLPFILLLLTSSCLYSAGMVWNDFFDLDQDRRERPSRPIPSGQISRRQAAILGTILMAAGLAFALLAGAAPPLAGHERTSLPALLAMLLVLAIFLYDGWLKRTWMGPLGMGTCRLLNVLLGLSLAGNLPWSRRLHLAGVVGSYIVGVTWLARTEARQSDVNALRGAALVMLASLLLAIPIPVSLPEDTSSVVYPYLLVALGWVVGLPVYRAILQPTPQRVQAAVHRALLALIGLDAVLATALAGAKGLLILLLLSPGLYLSRKKWLYAT